MSYCASCGKEIGEEDRFCRVCGKSVEDVAATEIPVSSATDTVADAGPAPEDLAPSVSPSESAEATQVEAAGTRSAAPLPGGISASSERPRRRWLVPVVVILIVAAVGVAAVVLMNKKAGDDRAAEAAAKSAHKAEIAAQKSAASKALAPFQKLDSALTVGVNFDEYGRYVRDAKYASDSYNPADATGKGIHSKLVKAAKLYAAANDAWNDSIQMKFTGDKLTSHYWISRYGGLTGLLKNGAVTAKNVQQVAWAAASLQVAAAVYVLNEYGAQK